MSSSQFNCYFEASLNFKQSHCFSLRSTAALPKVAQAATITTEYAMDQVEEPLTH